MAAYQFKVEGLQCVANCFHHRIWEKIKADPQGVEASYDPVFKIITISFKNDAISENEALKYLNSLDGAVRCKKMHYAPAHKYWSALRGTLALVLAAAVLIITMLTPALPVLFAVAGFSTLVTLLISLPSFVRTTKDILAGAPLTMDALFSVSVLSALGVSVAALFISSLPMMFELGLFVYGFRQIGYAIEETMKDKIRVNKTFVQMTPATVLRSTDAVTFQTSLASKVAVGEYVQLSAGAIIAFDGVTQNDVWLNTTAENGALAPSFVKKGTEIAAGYQVYTGSELIVQVSTTVKKSALAKRDLVLGGIKVLPPPQALLADKINTVLNHYIPLVFYAAFVSTALMSLFFPPTLAIQCGITVLLVACPCVIGLVMPLGFKIGLQKLRDNKVEVTDTQALHRDINCDAAVFDLNGTLTSGKPAIVSCTLNPEMLAVVQAMESQSSHPFASVICGIENSRQLPKPVINFEKVGHHGGIAAEVDGKKWRVGNSSFMQSLNIKCPITAPNINNTVYVACENKLVGKIVIADCLRADAHQVIEALIKDNKAVYVCTGSSVAVAQAYASKLGLDPTHVFADCGAEGKIDIIRKLQKKAKTVAMIGDGDNDCFAMKAADYAIAVRRDGGEKAQQEAQAIVDLSHGSLWPVRNLFTVAKHTMSNIRQNLLLSIGLNALTMILPFVLVAGMGVAMNPAIGAGLMVGVGLVVLANAYRFKAQELPRPGVVPAPKIISGNSPKASRFPPAATPHYQANTSRKVAASEPRASISSRLGV